MAEITASMVKELRERTDAPMMECKKALTEAAGDLERAEELLRVTLGSKASKAASRVTAEGVVTAHIEGKVGVLLEVNCETDFVAKNDDFLAFSRQIAALIARHDPANVDAIASLSIDGTPVETARAALIGKIGNDMFFIGDETGPIRVRTSGRLQLGINDDVLDDNSGNFRVVVYY